MYDGNVLQEGAHAGDGGMDTCLSRFPSPLPERMVDKRPNVEWHRLLIISLKDIIISSSGRSLDSARPGHEPASVWRIYSNPSKWTYFYIKCHPFFLKGWCTTKREQANLEGQNVVRSVPGDTIPRFGSRPRFGSPVPVSVPRLRNFAGSNQVGA
jgi:hypothetical protein